jgi:hypothetical protein
MTDLTGMEMDRLAESISRTCGVSRNHCRKVLREVQKSETLHLMKGALGGPFPHARPAPNPEQMAPIQFPLRDPPPTMTLGATGDPAAEDPGSGGELPETVSGNQSEGAEEIRFHGVPTSAVEP